MNTLSIPVGITALSLQGGQVVRIEQAQPLCISARRGRLWITIEGDAHDIFLAPGQSFEAAARTRLLVSVFHEQAAALVQRLPRAQRGDRLRHRLRAWRASMSARLRAAITTRPARTPTPNGPQ